MGAKANMPFIGLHKAPGNQVKALKHLETELIIPTTNYWHYCKVNCPGVTKINILTHIYET